jgi:hypothetical protein
MNDKQKRLIIKQLDIALAPLTIVEKIIVIESYGKSLRRKNSADTEEEVARARQKMTGKRILDVDSNL